MQILKRKPKLSVIVITYDMARELPRTLYTLSAGYQQDVTTKDYEVIVVDNGSPTPVTTQTVQQFGPNFSLHVLHNAPPSPAQALNKGVALAKGDYVCMMIDGARMVTPGLIRHILMATGLAQDPTLSVSGWHIGPDLQQRSVKQGYNQTVEDQLLDKIDWQHQGYKLFDIAVPAASCPQGCFMPIAESNAVTLKKKSYLAMGGYDTAFKTPGGGLINLDFYKRALERSNTALIMLSSEGTFHQIHGGISTNVDETQQQQRYQGWLEEYRHIRGMDYTIPDKQAIHLGQYPLQVMSYLQKSAEQRLKNPAKSD